MKLVSKVSKQGLFRIVNKLQIVTGNHVTIYLFMLTPEPCLQQGVVSVVDLKLLQPK